MPGGASVTPAVGSISPAAAGWAAAGATGGQLVFGGVTTAYAICLRLAPGTATPTVVVARSPGPAVAATTTRVIATCPSGELLLGGGGEASVTKGSASPSLHLIGTFPSDAQGRAVANAAVGASSWSALADAGGRTGTGVQTVAFALCAHVAGRQTSVALASRPGPLRAGSATSVTATCPASSVLISGGALTGPNTGSPQQGLHLTGSFPSGTGGAPVTPARPGAAANSWTARSESGGQGSPAGTATTTFALCLRA
jgi:hypothetical protein